MTRMRQYAWNSGVWAATLATMWAAEAAAQTTLDRVDPSRVEATVPRDSAPAAAPHGTAITPAQPVDTDAAAPVMVGAITLSGLEVLHPSDFADVFGSYVGRTLSADELAGLADALAARARAKGFVLATATIPPQPLSAGILRVAMDEGRIDEVRVRGGRNEAVVAALQPMVGRGPARRLELERRLLIAGDLDGLWLRRSRIVREGGRNILEIDIVPDPVSGTVGVDNWGSRPIGPLQADLHLRISQLIAADDLVTFTALATPTAPSEFGYVRVRYAKRVSAAGTEVSISGAAARTRPGSYLSALNIEGNSWTWRLDALHPLIRQREAGLWLSGSLGVRTVRQERQGRLARRDRLTVARAGLNGYASVSGGKLRASATVSQGLDLFDATTPGDPLASRDDADGTFTMIGLAADWTRAITGRLSGKVAVASQIAAQPLLVSEEIGMGGGEFLRAYDYGERSGDKGTMVSGELRWAVMPRLGFVKTPVLYGFLEGGRVTNLRDGFGGGSLASAGGGLRTKLGDVLLADIGLAVPLTGDRYDSGNTDPVVNFRLSKRF